MEKIDNFKDEYFFLSNYYEADVTYNGLTFHSNEAAFQAMKNLKFATAFCALKPNTAKKVGRNVELRKDWEQVKDNIMYEIVKAKFTQNIGLKTKLLSTGNAILIEGNTWNDKYWGVCDGEGKNKLGEILMRVREELLAEVWR